MQTIYLINKPKIGHMQTPAKLLLACLLVVNPYFAHADCIDNLDGTFSCTDNSEFIDATLTGAFTIDTTGGAATLSNTTTESVYSATGTNSTLSNSLATAEAASLFNITGNNAVSINNAGGFMLMSRSVSFDSAGWTNDANGLLYNNGVLAGYAAAINANANTPLLTVNNTTFNSSVYYPIASSTGITGLIFSFGDYTAAIHTNTPQLVVNNNGSIGNIVSYGAGTTTLNYGIAGGNVGGSFGDIYIVDRNPLLTTAQAQNPSLALAYNASEVGARNSVINLRGYSGNATQLGSGSSLGGNLFLGSGAHVINNIGGLLTADIFVDQRDSDIVDVVGGLATTVGTIHGARTFSLISEPEGFVSSQIGNITINDVVGSVNTISHAFSGDVANNFTANGLGNNNITLKCLAVTFGSVGQCFIRGATSGFTNYNLNGAIFQLLNNVTVTNNINVNGEGFIFGSPFTLTANDVVVSQNSFLGTPGGSIGNINGNLINKGSLLLEDTTLDVSGNVDMQSGSKLFLTISAPDKNGLLNVAGISAFATDSTVIPRIVRTEPLQGFFRDVRIVDGMNFTIASNATGIPKIQNDTGFLQWTVGTETGDLVLTANVGVPGFLKNQLTRSAQNATEAVFSYTGLDEAAAALQTELIKLNGINAIRAAERLRPETNDGSIRAVQMGTDKLFNFLDNRLLSGKITTAQQANNPQSIVMAANESMTMDDTRPNAPSSASKGIWVQGFGDRALQQNMDGFDGYSISAAGMGMGVDREFDFGTANTRLGFAVGYNRSNVSNTGNTVNNRIDINSFMAAAYASQDYDSWYINGILGLGRNTYESNRRLSTHITEGRHDSWQLSGRVDAGWSILINDNLKVIPTVAFDYTGLKESGYKEKGTENTTKKVLDQGFLVEVAENGLPVILQQATPISLEYQSRSFNSVRTGIGSRVLYGLQEPTWAAELELRGLYRHEFGDLAQDSVARFVFGGDSFKSPGQKPARDSVLVGGSLRLTSDIENDQIALITSYDAELREKYIGQTMSLAVRYDFDQASNYLTNARSRLSANKSKEAASLLAKVQSAKATEQDIATIQQAIKGNNSLTPTDPADAAKQKAIDATIQTWLTALRNKNLDVYFNSYAADFEASEGITRQQWERKRKAEISKAPNTAVKVSYFSIESNGDHALVVFTETSTSNQEQEAVRKIVDLEQKNGRWLIVREDSMALQD